ncbi:MAG: sigma-70 family RNA polymerase sigma factor [Planctomycetes bacterium]|nr:sigma-70 family RNA polymerase sigma factor [Planctomycetota bacterium]
MHSGRRANLERCFDQCAQRAWKVAYALTGDPHLAFDVVQQAFLVAARKTELIPAESWPWFSVVVAGEAANARRKRRPATNVEMQAMDDKSDPALAVVAAETRDQLRRALDDLPDHERQALTLIHLSGLTHAQAAIALGLPMKTVSTRVARGLERLRGKPSLEALALAPVIAPPGGWEAAVSAWKSSAFAAAAPVATAVQVGGIVAMNKALVAVAAVVALAVGLAGGWFGRASVAEKPPQANMVAAENQPEKPVPPVKPEPEVVLVKDEAEIKKLREEVEGIRRLEIAAVDRAGKLDKELGALRLERDEIAARADRAEKDLAVFVAQKAERGPTFTFGDGGKLEGVRDSNWQDLADAHARIVKALARIKDAQARGEPPPRDAQIELQKQGERFRVYEYAVLDRLPSAARFNGESTHPITLANIVAAMLKQAGNPLTNAQVESINRLGEDFEGQYKNLTQSYGPETLRIQKLLDEYSLKGVFRDKLMAVLTAEQRAIVADPAIHKIAGRDLLCPTLMLIHSSPVITGASLEVIRGKLAALIARDYELTDPQKAQLTPWIEDWSRAVESICTPVPEILATSYTFEQGEIAGRATAALLARMVKDMPDLAQRAKLMDEIRFMVPRVIAPAEPK